MILSDFSKGPARTPHSPNMANHAAWRLTSRGILSVVAVAAGSALIACSSRVDIASDEQPTTGDGGSTGGASAGTGGTASTTGGAPSATGGATSETGGAASGTGGSTAASGGTSTGGASPGSGGAGTSGPSAACSAAPEPGNCLAYMPRFYFDPASNTCEEFIYGGCGGNANNYASLEDCEETCTKGDAPVAVISATTPSCAGFGEQVSGPGTPAFTTEGFTVSRRESWGCGCATRPEFVMLYAVNAEQKIELRLCHDESADTCEALCTVTLEYDLSGLPPHVAPDFVFPPP